VPGQTDRHQDSHAASSTASLEAYLAIKYVNTASQLLRV
jgi:hypothetical protein